MNKNEAIIDIAQTAGKFKSSIVLQFEDKYIDVKSILGLFISLNTGSGYELHIHGPDEEEAKRAMAETFSKYGMRVALA